MNIADKQVFQPLPYPDNNDNAKTQSENIGDETPPSDTEVERVNDTARNKRPKEVATAVVKNNDEE